MMGEFDMASTPKKRLPISPPLNVHRYDNENLFLQYEEREAYERFMHSLNLAMGTYLASAATLPAREARLRGINRACADALVHRALSGKTRTAGLSSIAAVQMTFDDQVTELHDLYAKNSGGPRGA